VAIRPGCNNSSFPLNPLSLFVKLFKVKPDKMEVLELLEQD
jgi:hypothetical protein